MTEYTIGAVFTQYLQQVLLIKKLRPQWQLGLYNFPGGKLKTDENVFQCVAREFKEETDLNIPRADWFYIGVIDGGNYKVHLLTVMKRVHHGVIQSLTDEECDWFKPTELPMTIDNLIWLVPFAMDWHMKKEEGQQLVFGEFKYR